MGERWIAAVQAAGVLATAWFVWHQAVLPRLGRQSLASIAGEALLYVLLAWACGAIVTFWIYLVISLGDLAGVIRFSLRSSAAAMWFAPAIVLLTAPGPAAFAVSVFLVANATRHLISQWCAIEAPLQPRAAPRLGPAWNVAPVMMGSLTAQAGLVAMLWHYGFLAAALLAGSTAILTSLCIASGAYGPEKPPPLPHTALSVALTFLLAAALTTGGLAAHGRGRAQSEAASDGSGSGSHPATRLVTDVAARADENMAFGGDFPGVILLPKVKPDATLLVPAPSPLGNFGAPLRKPIGIPFSGEYWMFRPPAERPPRTAFVRRGSPSELSFHTTDGWPVAMEAYQKLDPPVATTCCSAIELATADADQYPGTVSIELILVDTASPDPPLSLGGLFAAPALRFPIPSAAALRKFDEIKVVFHRDRMRADKSARIAIERFVLTP
jgi:hypothetical protein